MTDWILDAENELNSRNSGSMREIYVVEVQYVRILRPNFLEGKLISDDKFYVGYLIKIISKLNYSITIEIP